MTALPPILDLTPDTTTKAGAKGYFTSQRAFLAGLLGATGNQADALAALGALAGQVVAKTAAYTLLTADRGKVISTTGTWTLSLTAAATMGAGFSVLVINGGTGVLTIDPNASELIDGVTTVALSAGMSAFLVCDGTAWTSAQIPYASAFARTILDDADAAAMRATLGLAATPLVSDLTALPAVGLKQPCKLLAASNITLATGGLITVDAVATTAGMRVLCAGQTAPAENGIYLAATGAWTRAPDADATAELAGAMVMIERGGVYGGTRWATSWKAGATLNTASMSWFRMIDTGEPLGRMMGYTTTATAGGTTALFSTSGFVQVFTGTANQSVTMPTTVSNFSFVGFAVLIANKSTGTLTIKANDGSTITTMLPTQSAIISCNSVAADTSAVWTVIMTANGGGVIERGSNANGKFTRWADGTMECWTTLAASTSVAVTWTYPYAFSAAPVVTGTAVATVLSGLCLDAAPGTTTATFSARDKTDARRADTCHLHAVGVWF